MCGELLVRCKVVQRRTQERLARLQAVIAQGLTTGYRMRLRQQRHTPQLAASHVQALADQLIQALDQQPLGKCLKWLDSLQAPTQAGLGLLLGQQGGPQACLLLRRGAGQPGG